MRAVRPWRDKERRGENRLYIPGRCRCLGTTGYERRNYEVMLRERDAWNSYNIYIYIYIYSLFFFYNETRHLKNSVPCPSTEVLITNSKQIASQCSKHLTEINLFNPHCGFIGEVQLTTPFYR